MKPAYDGCKHLPAAARERYDCLRVIGTGGMGTVVLARDRELGRLVALKLLRETCALFRARFRREARLMARLAHPSIVPVYGFEADAERPYLVLEYVRGGNLAQARLEPRDLACTLRGIVDALAHAHARGVVHRDVKPENVLLDGSVPNGRALLTDFGLALGPGEGLRDGRRPAVAGTLHAMSPEQVRGDPVGPASDQFSLGVTLYRQLTGEWPFRGRTVADVIDAIQRAEPVPPRARIAGVPAALERVVLRCLEKDPARRFGSMQEVGEALDRFLANRSLFRRLLALLGRRPRRAPQRPTGRSIHPPSVHALPAPHEILP